MITLNGTLRQSSEVTIKDKPMLKLWVEHTQARDGGVGDLKIEELFVPVVDKNLLPPAGESVVVEVRPYVSRTGGLSFAAQRVVQSNGSTFVRH